MGLTGTRRMTDRLAKKLHWFVDRLADPPQKLHVGSQPHRWRGRGMRSTTEGGSILGSPDTTRDWDRWLYGASDMMIVLDKDEPCFHVGRPEGTICQRCVIRDEDGCVKRDADGNPLGESGLRDYSREVYRYPMRAAMAHVGGDPPSGRPSLTLTLIALARSGGNPVSAAEALARRYPVMGDPRTARGHFLFALERLQAIWPQYDRS